MSFYDTALDSHKAGKVVSGVEKYRQALQNLLLTRKNERFFSHFGLDLEDSVFENYAGEGLEILLVRKIDEAVKLYIPEIKINFSRSSVEEDSKGGIEVRIVFVYGGEEYEEVVKIDRG